MMHRSGQEISPWPMPGIPDAGQVVFLFPFSDSPYSQILWYEISRAHSESPARLEILAGVFVKVS